LFFITLLLFPYLWSSL